MFNQYQSIFPNTANFLSSKVETDRSTNFMNKLIEESTKKCTNYLTPDQIKNTGIMICQKDLMIASSCVLLSKANSQMGDYKDNFGDCKYEIQLAKENISKHYDNFPHDRADRWLKNLSISIHSFDA